ncbi:ribosome maturation factor RimM [Natronogracilivirga saccharolytica]|uniref:Ribosome maturation factor RimM n=1 Tax=Natronogracilivirga saccharolytica TaxID=2812953 RepID=A0A8J7UUJ0_9BACT|nr:ribosome maturation factor RimM [Natronogracilivirga saccharolytica]MBP3191552.1 16S rRNA processing protein RimM [Natronogracilivirga saccharolytica]
MIKKTPPGLSELGKVVKAQGTRGGLLIEVFNPASVNELPELVYIRYPDKQWVPYRLSDVREHKSRSRNLFFVILEGISSRTEAESLRDLTLMTDQPVSAIEDEESSVAGYNVLRSDGSHIGVVSDILETPAYDILVIQAGEKQVLIPWVDQYVTDCDHTEEQVMTKNTLDLESLA